MRHAIEQATVARNSKERLGVIKQTPRQASIDDIEWLCEEVERLRELFAATKVELAKYERNPASMLPVRFRLADIIDFLELRCVGVDQSADAARWEVIRHFRSQRLPDETPQTASNGRAKSIQHAMDLADRHRTQLNPSRGNYSCHPWWVVVLADEVIRLRATPETPAGPCVQRCSLIALDDDNWKCNECMAVFRRAAQETPARRPCDWPDAHVQPCDCSANDPPPLKSNECCPSWLSGKHQFLEESLTRCACGAQKACEAPKPHPRGRCKCQYCGEGFTVWGDTSVHERSCSKNPDNALKANSSRELTLQDFGYAPGNYTIKCLDCGQEALWCDKRAARCETCAKQAMAENRKGLAQNGGADCG